MPAEGPPPGKTEELINRNHCHLDFEVTWLPAHKEWTCTPSSGKSREGRVPDRSAKISIHRKILKNPIKQSNCKDFEQGPVDLPMKYFCPLKSQVRGDCHGSARPALSYSPLGLPGSCKAGLTTPAGSAELEPAKSFLLTGSQEKLDNLHKITQRTSITTE